MSGSLFKIHNYYFFNYFFLILTLFLFFLNKKFYAHKKLKKPPSKVAQKNSNTAPTAQTEEFMFQNVAYRPTVYKTGVQMIS